MFEHVLLGRKIDRETYKAELPAVRQALLDAQFDVQEAKRFGTVILIAGTRAAGRSETVNTLLSWFDPRHVRVHDFSEMSDEEKAHPPMWRYWRCLPPKGRIAIFFTGWYLPLWNAHMRGQISDDELEHGLRQLNRFEQMLNDEGVQVIKIYLHIDEKLQKQRIAEQLKDKYRRARVTASDRWVSKHYDRTLRSIAEIIRLTNTPQARWHIVEASDEYFRELSVARLLTGLFNERLAASARPNRRRTGGLPKTDDSLLAKLDLSPRLSSEEYEKLREKWQAKLVDLVNQKRFRQRAAVVVLEGMDAAGKGGTIRLLSEALDARSREVIPVAAPSAEELAHPYLWRFWRALPRPGHVTLFDRSWYGRVLVERVEKLISPADVVRAYEEINLFEEELVDAGIVVAKFWLQISPDEQLRRFQERENTEYKRFKITDEDWRNREKWPQYQQAACDMFINTDTLVSPWHVIAAEDKRYARIEVLKRLCKALKAALE